MKQKITSFWCSEQGEELLRADYFGTNGSSTKTCRTVSEAQGFINACKTKER